MQELQHIDVAAVFDLAAAVFIALIVIEYKNAAHKMARVRDYALNYGMGQARLDRLERNWRIRLLGYSMQLGACFGWFVMRVLS